MSIVKNMSKFASDTEIKELIHQYKEHDCLWNIYSPNYKDKNLKQRAWAEIAHFLDKTPNEVKRKMQYLRAAYVHEKRRVDASKRSDIKTVHKPVLFYYKEMDFLDNIVIWRKFKDNKDACNTYSESAGSSQDFEIKEFVLDREDDCIQEPELTCKLEACDESDFNNVTTSTPLSYAGSQSSTTIKKNDNSINVKSFKALSSTSATKPQTKSMYCSFGRTIALQLQHLPLEEALLAMSEIQNIITVKSLENIRNIQNNYGSGSQSETEENYGDVF